MRRIYAKHWLGDAIDRLFDERMLVTEDGAMSREIARVLSPLRENGQLIVGFDRRFGKSILVVNGIHTKRRKDVPFGRSIFYIS